MVDAVEGRARQEEFALIFAGAGVLGDLQQDFRLGQPEKVAGPWGRGAASRQFAGPGNAKPRRPGPTSSPSSAHASLEMLTVRFSPHVPARTLWPSASRVSTRSCDHRHTWGKRGKGKGQLPKTEPVEEPPTALSVPPCPPQSATTPCVWKERVRVSDISRRPRTTPPSPGIPGPAHLVVTREPPPGEDGPGHRRLRRVRHALGLRRLGVELRAVQRLPDRKTQNRPGRERLPRRARRGDAGGEGGPHQRVPRVQPLLDQAAPEAEHGVDDRDGAPPPGPPGRSSSSCQLPGGEAARRGRGGAGPLNPTPSSRSLW